MLKKKIDNPRYPHRVRIVRVERDESVNPYKRGEEREIVVYDGIGRSYTDTTTTGDQRMEKNRRKASIPVRYDEWGGDVVGVSEPAGTDGPYVPMSGDRIEAWKGLWHETGEVKDAESDNDRTIVYWEMGRN